ncbi:MAG: large repetitive protein, partial [Gaiellaceae bacterium]|nr:large repetitive protein [Gaiellaceae bacterium]
YYRPSAGGTFTVNANGSTDGESGIKSGNAGYTFSPLTDFAGSSQTGSALAVTFTGSSAGSGSFTAHSTNNAGLDSNNATYNVTADSTAPASGSLTVNSTGASNGGSASYLTSGSSVSIATTPFTDGGSGMQAEVLNVQQATLANDVCGTYGSSTTITGASYGVGNGNCYRFTLTATDRVGNVSTLTTTVKVDTTAPVAPAISFSGLSAGNTFASGTQLFYRPSTGGTFTVDATGASDPETGIKTGNAGYTFSTLSGFATTAQTGNKVDGTFDASSTGSGAQSVVATNNAGVSSGAAAYSLTPDSGVPTGGLLSINPYSGSLTITVLKTDFTDAVSGIATNAVSRSNPQAPAAGTCPNSGYAGATPVPGSSDVVPADGQCYEYTLTGTDRVGNVATYRTIVLVDTTGPAGGSVQNVNGLASLNSVNVDWDSGTDAESGIANVAVQRAVASLSGSTCGTFGAWTTIVPSAAVSPVVDSAVSAGNCYTYRIVVTNQAGIASTFTSPSVAALVNASPIQLASGSPSGAYLGGTTLWLGPAAANQPFTLELTTLGRNGVTSATWQGKAGSLQSTPTTDTTTGTAPFGSTPYSWDGSGLTDSVQVTRNPGATVDTLTVKSDLNDPTGSITYNNGNNPTHSIHVQTSAADAESGVAGVQVLRAETSLTGSTCDTAAPSWSSFTPVTLNGGGFDTTLADSHCYRYELVVTDNVGNTFTAASANVAQVPDVTPPTFVSASTNPAGTQLAIAMSETLDASATTPASAFSITYNGVTQPAATAISVAGATITLTLSSRPDNSEDVKVRYSQPSTPGDRVRDSATPAQNETSNFGPAPVVNNTTDTVAPALVSASANGATLTLMFSEDLAGAAPGASAFAVSTGSTNRSIAGLTMSGKVVTLTLGAPVTSNDNVVVAYTVPLLDALRDAAANGVAAFTRVAANQTPISAPPTSGGTGGGAVVAAPAASLVSVSPDDGSTVVAVSTITATANQAVTWTHVNVTRPDGSVAQLAGASGASASWPFSPSAPGLYVLRGTLVGDGGSEEMLAHFTIWAPPTGGGEPAVPVVQKNAVPFAAGELKSSDGRTLLAWPIGAFSDSVVVEVAPRLTTKGSNLPSDALIVQVTAFLRSTHAPVNELGGVADVRFTHGGTGARPVTSTDGKSWRDIAQLPTLALPDGQSDGWFRDSDGTVHVLTRHLSFYALVGEQVSSKLVLRIVTVRRLWLENRSFVAVRMSLTAPARVTGSFVAPDGTIVPGQTIKTPTRHAGATILRVPLTIRKPGLYRLQLRAEGAGQTVNRTAKIKFLRTQPLSPVWQDGAVRVAVVQGAKVGPLDKALGKGFVVRHVTDAALYQAIDTNYRTAAAAIVVDLATVPTYTLAELHALLPEVKIVGLAARPSRAGLYRSLGVSVVLPRTAPTSAVSRAIKQQLRGR